MYVCMCVYEGKKSFIRFIAKFLSNCAHSYHTILLSVDLCFSPSLSLSLSPFSRMHGARLPSLCMTPRPAAQLRMI